MLPPRPKSRRWFIADSLLGPYPCSPNRASVKYYHKPPSQSFFFCCQINTLQCRMKVHFSPFLSLWVPYWTATCKISTPPTSIFPPFKFDRRPTIRQRRMIFCFQMSLFCQMFLVDRLVESDQAGAWRKWRLSALQCYPHLENLHPITKPPPAFLFYFPIAHKEVDTLLRSCPT